MGCAIGQSTLFGTQDNNYLKFQGSDLIAVEGPNTVERQLLGSLRFPYKQLLKGRVILKPGQVNYLLNHLGLGDNATLVSISAKYDTKSTIEEDNYVLWSFYDDLTNVHPMAQYMMLTGNSSNRVKQLYLTNPNATYPVILDVIVANIDDTYNFFNDTVNQVGTTFVNLAYTDVQTHLPGESVKIVDKDAKPLIYFILNNIETIEISDKILIIDDSSLGKIFLAFITTYDAKQAYSRLNYALEHLNADITNLPPDDYPPIIYWYANVNSDVTKDYIYFNGSSASVPYDTNSGFTFSTSFSFTDYAVDSKIEKSALINLLISSIQGTRDDIISITSSDLLIIGSQSNSVSNISGDGTYSVTFNFSDIAGNNLTGVIMNLTINP